MATQYGKPSRITLAKVLLTLSLLAVVYLGYAFVPPYARYWSADSVLNDEASKVYQRRGQTDGWDKIQWEAARRIRGRLEGALKVDPRDIYVAVEREKDAFVIKTRWKAEAKFLFIGKSKVLNFQREIRTELR
jgi:hypothetical protein